MTIEFEDDASRKYQFAKFVRGFQWKINPHRNAQRMESVRTRRWRLLRLEPILSWLIDFEDNKDVTRYKDYYNCVERIYDYYALVYGTEDGLYESACRKIRMFEKKLEQSGWDDLSKQDWKRLNSYFNDDRGDYV